MAPTKATEKTRERKVTLSGAVPQSLVPVVERTARANEQTVSAFIADAIAEHVKRIARALAKAS